MENIKITRAEIVNAMMSANYDLTYENALNLLLEERFVKRPTETYADRLLKEQEQAELDRLTRKAEKLGKTVEEVKRDEEAKAALRNEERKYKRYMKEVVELQRELDKKLQWIKLYEEKRG